MLENLTKNNPHHHLKVSIEPIPDMANAIWCNLSIHGLQSKSARQVPVSKHKITIGSDKKCDVILKDTVVSKQHLRIEKTANGKMTLFDFPESNGIFVKKNNGVRFMKLRTNSQQIYDGDTIGLGPNRDVVIQLHVNKAPQPSTSSSAASTTSSVASSDTISGRLRKRSLTSVDEVAQPKAKRSAALVQPTPAQQPAKKINSKKKPSIVSSATSSDCLFLVDILTCNICQSLLYEPVK